MVVVDQAVTVVSSRVTKPASVGIDSESVLPMAHNLLVLPLRPSSGISAWIAPGQGGGSTSEI
jgi:hypothetical protein